MWKIYLCYWLVIVGATTVIQLVRSPWPPSTGILVPIGWMAALAGAILVCSAVAKVLAGRHALKRRRAVEALDALNVTSTSSRGQFLAAAGPFMLSGWTQEDKDELANRIWTLFCAIRSHPAGSIDFARLHALQEAARKQRELEAWSARWQPSWVRDLLPELGPRSDAILAAAVAPLAIGGGFASIVLVWMAFGEVGGYVWWGLLAVVSPLLSGLAERKLDDIRKRYRVAVPEIFSEDGSPKIPDRYDRTRN